MKLKCFVYTLVILLASLFIYSCNSSGTDYADIQYSNNSMIYSFTLKGAPKNKHDSTAYPVLASTLFAIDQHSNFIYNPDSLPYQIRLTKFLPTITFAAGTSCKVEVVDPDSTWEWKVTDSVDFSKPIELLITPPSNNNVYQRRYNIKLNVHQIDPDTIEWKQILPSLTKPSGSKIKALVNDDDLFVYVRTSSAITVYTSDKNTVSWTSTTVSGLSAANIKIETVTAFGNSLYVADNSGAVFTSPVTDGINWTPVGNTEMVHSILGVLPGASETKDSLLVVTNNGSVYSFAKSIDMSTIVPLQKIKGFAANAVPSDFPSTGFSSSTNYLRDKAGQNLLFVSGGVTFENNYTLTTWLINEGRNNILEVSPVYDNDNNRPFLLDDDFKTVLYDNSLYGFTNDSIYISNLGYNWKKAPEKQAFNSVMRTNENQSVFVDKNNYIWVVGDMEGSGYDIWKGQLNRIRK